MYSVNETLAEDMMTASKMINALKHSEMILKHIKIATSTFYYRSTFSVKENKKNPSSKNAFMGQISLMKSCSCMNIHSILFKNKFSLLLYSNIFEK